MEPTRPVRIRSAQVQEEFRVRLEFTDGTVREVDLEKYLHGAVFQQIRKDPDVFRSLKVDEKMGTIYWDNGADIDPDVLYQGLTPAWMEPESNESKVA
ncbi:MAG: DUF2442 domain-containing protein [Syntrophobacteraceae bacterium]